MQEEIKFVIRADSKEGQLAIQQMTDALTKMGGQAEDATKKTGSSAARTDEIFKKVATGSGVLSAAMLGVGVAATKMAMDAVESENLFVVSLGDMEKAGRAWSESLRDQLGLNAFEVRKMLGVFFNMQTAMGVSRDSAFEMSKGLTQLAFDMASFFNLKPEEAFQKLQSGISGEIEPLKRLGIVLNQATLETQAATMGITKQWKEMTEAEKVAIRYQAIMAQTANAQNDLARTIDSPTNQLRILGAQFDEIMIKMGQGFMPVAEKLIGWASAITGLLVNVDGSTNAVMVTIVGLTAAIPPLLLVAGKLATTFGLMSGPAGAAGATLALGGLKGMISLFPPALAVFVTAWASWKIGQWIGDVTGLNSKIQDLLNKLQGLRDPTQDENEALAHLAQTWEKHRKEVAANQEALAKTKPAIVALSEEMQKYVEKMRSAANPQKELNEQLNALRQSGFSSREVFALLGDDLAKASKELREMGKDSSEVDAVLQRLRGSVTLSAGAIETLSIAALTSRGELSHMGLTLSQLAGPITALPIAVRDASKSIGELAEGADPLMKKAMDAAKEKVKEFQAELKQIEESQRVWEQAMGQLTADTINGLTELAIQGEGIVAEFGKAMLRALMAEFFRPINDLLVGVARSIASIFTGGATGGAAGTATAGIGLAGLEGSLLAALGIPALGAVAGGELLGGTSGALIGGGLATAGASLAGIFGSLGAIGAFAGPIGAAVAAIGGIMKLVGLFSDTPIQAGGKEVGRDFGVDVGPKSITEFLNTIGLSEKLFSGIRKDILSSPKFVEDVLLPASQARGEVEQLIATFGRLEAFGRTFDLSEPLRKAVESGDFREFNEAWFEIFKNSERLTSVFGSRVPAVLFGSAKAVDSVTEAAEDLNEATESATKGIIQISDQTEKWNGKILMTVPSLEDEYKALLKVGDAAKIAAFQQDRNIQMAVDTAVAIGLSTQRINEYREGVGDASITALQLAASIGLTGDAAETFIDAMLRASDSSGGWVGSIAVISEEFYRLAEAAGIALDRLDEFAGGAAKGATSLDRLKESEASLLGEVVGLGEALQKQGLTLEQAQASVFKSYKDNIMRIAKQVTDLGLSVTYLDPLTRMILAFGAKTGLLSPEDLRSIGLIQTITIPGFLGEQEFLKDLGIPGFQHGGIVTSPTLAMIGEAGPEAVVPLGQHAGQAQRVEFHFHGPVMADDIEELVARAWTRRARRGGFSQVVETRI